MSRENASRFAVRDRGLRRVRTVTTWSAAGSAGLAVAAAIALMPATASPASGGVTAGAGPAATGNTGAAATPAASPGASQPSRVKTPTRRPHASRTTRSPRLTPPPAPPAPTGNGGRHASSGGS